MPVGNREHRCVSTSEAHSSGHAVLLLRHEPEAEPPAPNPFLTDVSHRLDDEAEDDAFGHRDYVDVLDETVPRLPSPFTLGLFGAWGSGKSSILEALGARVVRREDAAFARFDAWKYEGDPLRRQLMLAVTAQLGKTGKLKRRFSVRRHLERYDADIAGSRPRLELDWRGVVKAFVHAGFAAAFVYGLFRLLPELGVGETNTLKTTLTAATGAVTFVLTAVAGVVGIQRQQVTRHRLEDADQFAESFERLLRKGLAVPRLVIGVDNLDRCAPERVTEILAIIKTFLEPAREETEKALVFVIAADDAAIRRHLIAQEMAVSAATATPATQDDGQAATAEERVPDDVVRAVDEYLRKYFNGVIRLPTVIDEDVEGFVRTQLAGFADEHDLDAETRRSLTTLVGEFLEGNPRRIKQFVNGLELRVKLLRRRNDARRLGGPPDTLTVAEVMLIEERWPHRFATLCREPGQISEWHRRAVNEPNPPSVSRDEADWLRFLRSSERICRVPLAPYLVLKRSMPELRLEHHDAFVTALESRETERIRALLPELGRKREEYLDLVWTHFRRHLAHDR